MVHMYPSLHVVTYMTRIDYNALFNTTDCKGVRASVDRVSDSGFKGRRFESRRRQILFLFIEKFTEYDQTFIYILAGLSLCVICI